MKADATLVSGTTIVDTQGYEALSFIFATINTTAVTLAHGDDSGLSDTSAVTSDFIIGDVAYTAAGTGKVGYVGKKRYVEITIANPAVDVTITAIQESPLLAPTPSTN